MDRGLAAVAVAVAAAEHIGPIRKLDLNLPNGSSEKGRSCSFSRRSLRGVRLIRIEFVLL